MAGQILVPGIGLQAGDPPREPGGQVQEKPAETINLRVAKARQHPSYQVFSHDLTLPSIATTNDRVLLISGKVRLGLGAEDRLSPEQRQFLASQFEVPVEVIDKLLARVRKNDRTDAVRAAQELRTAIIDYKYLQDKFAQYTPPEGKTGLKTAGLQALRIGDTETAWELYLGLPRPPPPGRLRLSPDR